MKTTIREFYDKLNQFINFYNPNFEFNGDAKVSSILLFKEGLSRISEWRIVLNSSKFTFNNKEDFNLFSDISANLTNEMEDYGLYVEKIKEKTMNYNSRNFNFLFLYLYVYWDVLQNRIEIGKYGKENPYIPFVKIFENKNLIYFRDWFQINGVTMKKSKITRLPSLDNDFLDYIDFKCKLIGSDGIPNQERVNELWQEFQSLNK